MHFMRIMRIIETQGGQDMRPREVEKIIQADGWIYKNTRGSHKQFVHPTKPGKVTIPQHPGDTIDATLLKKILKQAGLK